MPIKLERYLEARGFEQHPFGTTNAEQEAGYLPAFFVRVSWFDELVGDPRQPASMIVFAPQGYGKTSHRLEVARQVSSRRDAPALVVTLNDFSPLLAHGVTGINLESYIHELRRLTLEMLHEQFVAVPHRLQRLQEQPRAYGRLYALLSLYTPLQALEYEPPPQAQQLIQAFQQSTLPPRQWLKELSALAAQAGFVSVYTLFDGLDERQELRDNPEAMFAMLRPLLDAPGVLQECGYAFKFFLPQDLEQPMQQLKVGRLDRIPTRSLMWSERQLVDMLAQRLSSYSQPSPTSPGRVGSFQDLCADDVASDVDLRLARAARSSPRRLIDLAAQVVRLHCEHATDYEQAIAAATLNAVLPAQNVLQRAGVQVAAIFDRTAGSTEQAPVAEPIPQLALAPNGEVWLGNQRVEQQINGYLFDLLQLLWNNRRKMVRYQDIQKFLYGETIERNGRADPEGSLKKLIRRLREALEPGKSASNTYIEAVRGQGLRLRNFRDT